MARKKSQTLTLSDPQSGTPVAIGTIEGSEDLTDPEEQIREKLAAEGLTDIRVAIYFRPPKELEFGYVGEMALEEWSQESMRKAYGGGDYKCQFKYKGENGRWQVRTQERFRINYALKPDGAPQSAPEDPAAVAKRTVDSAIEKISVADKDKDWFIKMMELSQQRSDAMIAMMQKNQTDMVTAIATLAAKGGGPPAQTQAMDLLAAMQVFDKIKGPGGGTDIAGMLLSVLKFSKQLVDEKAEGTTWIDKVLEALPQVLPRIIPGAMPASPPFPALPAATPNPANGAGAQNFSEQGRPHVDQPLPASDKAGPVHNAVGADGRPTPIQPPTNPEDVKAFIVFAIRSKLPQIRVYAQNNVDVEDVVDLLTNPLMIPPNQFLELATMLEKESWISDLFGGPEAIAPFDGWFLKLREAIIAERDAILESESKAE